MRQSISVLLVPSIYQKKSPIENPSEESPLNPINHHFLVIYCRIHHQKSHRDRPRSKSLSVLRKQNTLGFCWSHGYGGKHGRVRWELPLPRLKRVGCWKKCEVVVWQREHTLSLSTFDSDAENCPQPLVAIGCHSCGTCYLEKDHKSQTNKHNMTSRDSNSSESCFTKWFYSQCIVLVTIS